LSAWLRRNVKYLIVAVLVVLVVSLGVYDWYIGYLYDHLQTATNSMNAEAFESWLTEVASIEHVLRSVETNFDIREVLNYTYAANQFASILDWSIEVMRPPDFAEHLYLQVAGATSLLHIGLSRMATTPADTLRNLDGGDLLMLENLTTTFHALRDFVGTVEYACYELGPVQWLQQRGILAQVLDYIEQIKSIVIDIYTKYM
jgi:hypothetical protein